MAEIIEEDDELDYGDEPEFTEEQLLRQDEVEASCFTAAQLAMTRKRNLLGFVEACCSLASVLTEKHGRHSNIVLDFIEELEAKELLSAIAGLVISKVDDYVKAHRIVTEDGSGLVWDMEYIGEIADNVASLLIENGYQVWYPYIAEDENGNWKVYDYIEEGF